MAFLLAFVAATPAQAGLWDVFSSGPGNDWQNSPLVNDQDPVAKKLVTWLRVTDANKDLDTKELLHFAIENSDWPKLYVFRDRIEKGAGDLRAAEAAAWFDENPPRSADGIRAYTAALAALNRNDKVLVALKKFWHGAELNGKETAALAGHYKSFLTGADHSDRLDNLLWEQRFSEAEDMLPLVDGNMRKLAEARIALGRLSSKAPKFLKAVPAALQSDNGLLYERLKYRRSMGKDADAFALLQQVKTMRRADLWWRERNILARRAIEKHDFKRAYQIVVNHGMTGGVDYTTAEWTTGWLELEFLGHPEKAYKHFENFQNAVKSAVSKSRGAYWLARAAEKLKQPETAKTWYKDCAQFPSTFYGQICYEKLNGGSVDATAFPDDQVQPQDAEEFNGNELVEAVHILADDGLQKYMDPFFTRLLDLARTRADFVSVAKLARESGRLHFAVEANKQMQMKNGGFMFTEGYPLLPPVSVTKPESALIHAIVHRESMFNTAAASPAGARGLMQLMPGTARQVAHGIGKNYSPVALTENPAYNIELGASYLQDLVESYDGFYPLAIAAYNAGPRNVAIWIKEFGDPRSKKVNLIDWIEEIPIYETRNYVQRVMESYYMYKLRMDEEPQTVVAFKRG